MSGAYKAHFKRRILAAAFKEFSKKGYHKANLENVAASLNVARGTIYLYFKSKRALFEALSELQLHHLKVLLERHVWMAGDTAATAMEFYLESKLRLPQNYERMAIELLAESTRNRELKRERLLEVRKMQQIIVEVFQDQTGEIIARKEIREIALGAIALYNGLQMLKVLGYSDEELKNSWARSISLMIGNKQRDSSSSPALVNENLIHRRFH